MIPPVFSGLRRIVVAVPSVLVLAARDAAPAPSNSLATLDAELTQALAAGFPFRC